MDGLLKSPLLPECLNYLQNIAQFKEKWATSVEPKRDIYVSLKHSTIITSAGASTRIEGAKLTDAQIIERLDGLQIQSIRDRDEAEVAGYLDCKNYIFDHFAELTLSEHTIRSLHQMLMRYLPNAIMPASQRGAYKNITNSVVRVDHQTGAQEIVFETTPPGPQTETAMRNLVDHYQAFIHDPNYSDVEVIASFVVTFLAIHPFRDGNGRMSRLLTDLCLLQKGYTFCFYSSHEKMIEQTKAQYYVALRQTQMTLHTTPDINPWFIYFLKTLGSQVKELEHMLSQDKPGTLTKKENQIFELIGQHQPVTFSFLERESGIKKPTLKSILARLKKNGAIIMEGKLKGSQYRLK